MARQKIPVKGKESLDTRSAMAHNLDMTTTTFCGANPTLTARQQAAITNGYWDCDNETTYRAFVAAVEAAETDDEIPNAASFNENANTDPNFWR